MNFFGVLIMESQINSNQIPKNRPVRNYGIDLLRCFAMMMIVMLHTLSRSGLLTETEVSSFKYEIVWFIEIFCYSAVNCFIIISGYVSLHTKFRLSRIILLWLQVVFYNVLLTVIVQAINGSWDATEILRSFLPVSTDAYWFFTQYFVLCFFMPLINKLVLKQSIKQNGFFLAIMLIFFSVLPMLYALPVDILGEFNEKLFFTERGYSVLWMTVMYALGAVIRKYIDEGGLEKVKTYVYAILVIVSDVIIWIIHYICTGRENPVSPYFVVSYTSPFVVIAAVGLVMLFSKLRFGAKISKGIEFFSAGAFAVYLVHSQKDIYPIFKELVSPMLDYRVLKLLPCLLFTILFVFLAGTLADAIRSRLFRLLHIDKACKKIDKKFGFIYN